jgi:hypothetical protein
MPRIAAPKARELLVKAVSPKALYRHISLIVLRKNQANVLTSFLKINDGAPRATARRLKISPLMSE